MRHLIHVGFAKAGSSSLQRWFAANPHIEYAEGGLGGFRHIDELAQRCAAPPSGAVLRVTSSEGLATPYHATAWADLNHQAPPPPPAFPEGRPRVAATLRDLFGSCQILIVTRGFRGALLSNYSEFVRQGGALSPGEMFRALEQAIDAGSNLFDVDATAAAFAGAFGRENVILLPYEQLRDAPDAFLRALEEQTGLPRWEGSLAHVNAGLSPAELAWYPRLVRAADRSPLPAAINRAALRLVRRPFVARQLQPFSKAGPSAEESIPPSLIEKLRGCASILRFEPRYAPYAADYLL